MIPRTKNNLDPIVCISAIQKCIRRSMELEAMQFAVELHQSSKAMATMVMNRLRVIAHEDIDVISAPWVVPFVATAAEQVKEWYAPEKLGRSRMVMGNAIRLLCASPKSRIGDHFHASIGLKAQIEGFVPTIPDWAYDQHTTVGRKKGRGRKFFREVSTILVPPAARPDPYEDEAYRLWELKDKLDRPPTDDPIQFEM